MKQPLFKYTGSKRKLAPEIISYFPKHIKTYYEPFLGGGSVFLALLQDKSINVDKFILSDINETMIALFTTVQINPELLISTYEKMWIRFQEDPEYYYEVRKDYNTYRIPFLFNFLTRTCYNGTIRFNSKGEFNVSSHFGRKGIEPYKLEKIIWFYHNLMKNKDIRFIVQDFTKIVPQQGDVVYCDPPYSNSDELYLDGYKKDKFENWLRTLKCNYYFNLNGVSSQDHEEIMVNDLFDKKVLINSGKSSFSRLKNIDVEVKEYFYIKNNL